MTALLSHVARGTDPETTVEIATGLQRLVKERGRPHLLMRIGEVRDIAAEQLGTAWNHARFVAVYGRSEQDRANGRLREAMVAAHELLEQARTAGERAYSGADYDLATAYWFLGRVLKNAGGSQRALTYLVEAQRRFEAVEATMPNSNAVHMASKCLTERADCLRSLGRLDEAATVYDERVRRARLQQRPDERALAVAKLQLGTVRALQRRYQDALDAFAEARDVFTRLNEPRSVAVAWHQMGIVYQETDRPSKAEDAYRLSLALKVQLSDIPGQASTLNQLGRLYDDLGRFEEAASQFRRSADYHVTLGNTNMEGFARNNLANTLCKLHRWEEARQEILRAIECDEPFGHAAEPWKTWSILADIEIGAGRTDVAAQAKMQARACYLAYRRDGGENHDGAGRLALAVTEQMLAGDVAAIVAELDREPAGSSIPDHLRPFVVALRAIVAGSRDRSVADAPELDYAMAAELLLLVETLEGAAAGAA